MTIDLDHELTLLGREWLAQVEPITTAAVLDRSDARLLEPGRTPQPRRWPVAAAKVAAGGLIVIGVGVALRDLSDDDRQGSGGAATTATETTVSMVTSVPVAGDADLPWPPRLLIEASRIDYINEVAHTEIESGEIRYQTSRGDIWMNYWRDADIPLAVNGRALAEVHVLGTTATVYGDNDGASLSSDVPTEELNLLHAGVEFEGIRIEFRSNNMTTEQFGTTLESFHPTDDSTFMAALPAGAVTADERDRWVDAILFDTPLPNDFDTASLGNPEAVMMLDGFQGLPGRAAIAVACAWADQWFDADDAGDADARFEAADALGDIRSWAVFSNIEPYVVEDFAGLAGSLVAGFTVNGRHVDREMVDMAFSCSSGQIPNG